MAEQNQSRRQFRRSQKYPFLCGKVESILVCLFELVSVFGEISSLASGTSLLSFSLLIGLVLKFHSVRTSLMIPATAVSLPGYSLDVA